MWKVGRVLFWSKLILAAFGKLAGHREVDSNLSPATAATDNLLHLSRVSTRKGVR